MARTAKTTTSGTGKKTPAKTKADDSVTEEAAAPAPAPARKGGGGWILILLVVALCGGGAYLTYPQWYPWVADKLPEVPTLDFQQDPRVAGLSDRIAALEKQAGASLAKDETIQRLEQERERLRQDLGKALARLETVEASMASVREMAEAAARIEETAAAKESLQALSERLSAIEDRGAAVAGAADAERLSALAAARDEARKLAERMAELEKSQAQAATERETLAEMEKRLAAVEDRPAASQSGTASKGAVLLAVGQLRDAVRLGTAYQREYDAVKALAGADPGIGAALLTLGKAAKTGVPTLAVLREEFGAMASPLVAEARGQAADGWVSKIVAKVGSLVTIRRTDGKGGDDIEALVARAEQRLAAGDLAGTVEAVDAMKPVSTEAAAMVAPWLDRAKTRLAAERALAALHIHAVSSLSGAVKE
jgi:hypothetical protein